MPKACCPKFDDRQSLTGDSWQFGIASGGPGARLLHMYMDFGSEGVWYLYEFNAGDHESYISGRHIKRDESGKLDDLDPIAICGQHPVTKSSVAPLNDYFFTETIQGALRVNEERAFGSKPQNIATLDDDFAVLHTRVTDTYGPWVIRAIHRSQGFPLRSSGNVVTIDPPSGYRTSSGGCIVIRISSNKIAVVISFPMDSSPWSEDTFVYFCTWSGSSWTVGTPISGISSGPEGMEHLQSGVSVSDEKIVFWTAHLPGGGSYSTRVHTVEENGTIHTSGLHDEFSEFELGDMFYISENKVGFVDTQYGYGVNDPGLIFVAHIDVSSGISVSPTTYVYDEPDPATVFGLPFEPSEINPKDCASFLMLNISSGIMNAFVHTMTSDELPEKIANNSPALANYAYEGSALISTEAGFHIIGVTHQGSPDGSSALTNDWFPTSFAPCVQPSLRLRQRDDSNEFGSSRIPMQTTSKQGNPTRVGPNTYW